MCENQKDIVGTVESGERLFRVLLQTKRQREISHRNAEITKLFKRECDKGSEAMYIYEWLAQMFDLTPNYVGNICRRGVRYA